MGFFSNLFKKSEEKECCKKKANVKVLDIYSPMTGRLVPIEEVPDETFAGKILGTGVAIEPIESGAIVAPVRGKLIQIFHTNHAFTILTDDGDEILVHFGVNTVDLQGKGFVKLAEEGQYVNIGDPIINYDLPFLKEKAKSVMSPIIILQSEDYLSIDIENVSNVEAGKTLILRTKKQEEK